MEKSVMTTHVTYFHDDPTGDIVFTGRISRRDLVNVNLDKLDRMVINSPVDGPADVLQSLEILFRRIGEQNDQAA